MVPRPRLELGRLAAADFESAASTDFAIGAIQHLTTIMLSAVLSCRLKTSTKNLALPLPYIFYT